MTQELTAPNGERNAGGKKRGVLMIGGAAAIAAIAGLFVLTHSKPKAPPEDPAARAQAVSVIQLKTAPFAREMTFSGEVRARDDIRVAAPASGVRVLELLADEGDFVQAGQKLAKLDQTLAQAQILAAQASVKEAEAAAKKARDDYQRAESIRDSGALSTEAIAARLAQADAAEARLQAAKAQLADVNGRLQGGFVRAPRAGLIIDRQAEIGRLADGQMLFRIAGGNALEVAVELSEADMLALKEGQTATFTLVDGTEIAGVLRRAPAAVDEQKRTGQALFDLAANPKARAGMYVKGRMELATVEALSAPQSAVVFENGGAYVFVLGPDNRARRTKVIAGARAGQNVAIVDGLTPGARIVGAGAAFLQEGDLVRPFAAPSPQAAVAADGG